MNLSLTNTLTRKKDVFQPADPARVTMYVCGPTVYNYAHIGNARPPVVFDVLFRLLRRQYGEAAVLYARNFTDIDDKIIARMAETGESLEAVTGKYAAIYEADMAALGVAAPTFAPRATGHIADMIALIEALIAKGAAYRADSGVYFSVAADADYGKLSGRSQDDLKAGARVDGEDDKRAPSDFALWKAAKPGEPAWDAPFGRGRPGWHIECSAMIRAVLGDTIDIHGGGADLIFPHHENEIAQSETAHDHPLARVWLHNGFLTMDREKMSKSLGNIVTVHELLEQGWAGETLRWALLSAHYRAPLDWSDDLLAQAQASLDRLYQLLLDIEQRVADQLPPPDRQAVAALLETNIGVLTALSDDLNTPLAMGNLFIVADQLRKWISEKPEHMDLQSISDGREYVRLAGALLGVLTEDPAHWFRAAFGDKAVDIDALVARRVEARAAKDFATADRIRDELAAMGVEVMDGPAGSTWRRKG